MELTELKEYLEMLRSENSRFVTLTLGTALGLVAENERLRAEVERLKRSYVPQDVVQELLTMFEVVFGDTTPEGNTLWAYTKHACKEVERLRESTEKWKSRAWKYLYESIGYGNEAAGLERENERLQAELERARNGLAEELVVRAKALIESGKGSVTVIATGTLEAIREEARLKERESLLQYLESWAGDALTSAEEMKTLAKGLAGIITAIRAEK